MAYPIEMLFIHELALLLEWFVSVSTPYIILHTGQARMLSIIASSCLDRLLDRRFFAFVLCLPRVTLSAAKQVTAANQTTEIELPTTHSIPVTLVTLCSYTLIIYWLRW